MSKQIAPWIEGRLRPEPLASRLVYNTFFKRAPLYMATCMAAAVIGGVAFDKTIDMLWDMNNKGKQWKDLKHVLAAPVDE